MTILSAISDVPDTDIVISSPEPVFKPDRLLAVSVMLAVTFPEVLPLRVLRSARLALVKASVTSTATESELVMAKVPTPY